jgi:glycosyltransferase involved in cell wall biosynthesis
MSAPPDAAIRRVLIVSYHFPPEGAVGGLRPARFARLLPRFRWQPYVLSVNRAAAEMLDPERARGLDDVIVVRTREFPVITAALSKAWQRVRRSETSSSPNGDAKSERSGETLRQKFIRHVVSLALFSPDGQKEWALGAAWTSVKLIRKLGIACVVTTSPPASAHLVGLVSSALTKARWVADFRDPWLESLDGRPRRARSRAGDAVEAWMERTVIRRADRIITTTLRLKEALESRYALTAGKVVCVPNAIESRALAMNEGEKYERLTITYAGTLYEGRSPEPLFRAVSELIRERHLSAASICIKLIGNCEAVDGVDTRAMAARYGLEKVVEISGFVPRSEALRIMQKSHMLLVISPAHHELIVPAKVYDYLASGVEILALAEAGATCDLVNETASGRCFGPGDLEGIKMFLLDCMGQRSRERGARAAYPQFGDEYLTGRLAAELSASSPS